MKSKSESKFYKQLGKNISSARKKSIVKQETFAASLNLSRSSIVNIEAGRQKPSLYLLVRISLMVNVSIDKLIPNFAIENILDSKSKKILSKGMGKKAGSDEKFHEFYSISKNLMRHV